MSINASLVLFGIISSWYAERNKKGDVLISVLFDLKEKPTVEIPYCEHSLITSEETVWLCLIVDTNSTCFSYENDPSKTAPQMKRKMHQIAESGKRSVYSVL